MLRKSSSSSVNDMVPTLADAAANDASGEPDVRDYLLALWQRRSVIVLVAVVCAALGVGWSLLSPRLYEATALWSVNQRAGENTLSTVATLATSQAVLGDVLNEFKLGGRGNGYTIQRFRREALNVGPVPNTGFIRISVSLPDGDLAARVANAIGQRAQETARTVSDLELDRLRNQLQVPLDEAAKRLEEAQARRQEYRSEAQIDLLRRDVATLLDQREDLQRASIDIEAQRARVAQLEQQIGSRRPLGALTQRIEDNPSLLEAARSPGRDSSDLLGLRMQSEYVNDVYQKLDEELAIRRSDLAALETQMKSLAGTNNLDKGEQPTRLAELYELEAKLTQLDMEAELARKAYTDAAALHQGATLAVANRALQLQIVDPATPATESQSRMTSRNAVFGLGFGLLAGCFLALVPLAFSPQAGPHPVGRRRFGN
jgi:uncharacterized protein involved in exopolysaccharide biosynthesis